MFLLTSTFLGLVILTYGVTMFFQLFFKVYLPSWKALLSFVLMYLGMVLMATDLRFLPSEHDLRTIIFGEKTLVAQNPKAPTPIKRDAYTNPYLEINRKINTDYNIIFAKGTIDFSEYRITRGNIYIEINVVAAGGRIIAPKDLPIRIIINPSLAIVRFPPNGRLLTPFKTNVYKTPAYDHDARAITIKANIAFAGLDIIEK